MLESILRQVVPRPVLRKMALYVNTVKINTVDRLFFPEAATKQNEFILRQEHQAFPELDKIMMSIEDVHIRKGLERFAEMQETEYIYKRSSPTLIEPRHGWGLTEKKELIHLSLANAGAAHLRRPSLKYVTGGKTKVLRLKKAISLRDTSERAYFHFYNDVIAKIPFLLSHGIDVANTPLIIAEQAFSKPFFQELIRRSAFLSSLQWVVQKNQPVSCDEAIFCRPRTLNTDLMNWVVSEFDFRTTVDAKNRIFITRDPKRLRYISNMDEITPTLRKYHFRIVDTDQLSLEMQAKLLSGTSHLIAIHGAGLTNIIYRRGNPMQVLEIFPYTGIVPYHYAVLSSRYGYHYSAIAGSDYYPVKGSFKVDPHKLEMAIKKMLD